MDDKDVRQPADRAYRAQRSVFEVVASKLRPPRRGPARWEAKALRIRISAERRAGAAGASSLTAAELRVLPLLATHLSFPEIGTELFLSPNTVKSQAVSLYRKLGACSRSQAVAWARELALLEG